MSNALSTSSSSSRNFYWPGRILFFATLVATVVFAAAVVKWLHWDDRVYFYLKSQLMASEWRGQSIWLPDYKVVIDAKPIEGIEDNLSSIVYDHERNRLLALTNSPSELFVLTLAGDVVARYPLTGFGDSEGMGYMGNGLVVITDEWAQRLNFVYLPDEPRPVDISEAQFLALGTHLDDNKGFEGIAYDEANDRLFVVKERDPRKMYEVLGAKASLEGELGLRIIDRTDWIEGKVFGRDLSSVDFDADTGHLVILSDESKLLVELTGEGRFVSFRTFLGGFGDLEKTPPQPEGVTLDSDGNLYLVSEPNLFYVFSRE